jgi:polysaccharide biosynthesis/export protein
MRRLPTPVVCGKAIMKPENRLIERLCALFFVLFVLLPGCSTPRVPSLATPPPPYLYPQPALAAPDPQYRIQPGDILDIKFFYNPLLNETALPVRPDGRITLQLVADVEVAGLTPEEARSLLIKKYESSELRNVVVAVQVKAFGGQKIFVDGEVFRPGLFPLLGHITILQAIAQAGGMKETAQVDEVILIRRGPDNKPVAAKLDMQSVREGRDMTQDVLLAPYDIVFVPRTTIANIDIWVDQYIRRMLPFSLPSPIPQPTTTSGY